jgi:hypothetical protein
VVSPVEEDCDGLLAHEETVPDAVLLVQNLVCFGTVASESTLGFRKNISLLHRQDEKTAVQ